MNTKRQASFLPRMWFWAKLGARYLERNTTSRSFGREGTRDLVQRIYVINLDRQPDRWRRTSRELSRLRDRYGSPLGRLSRRFSAVDARYIPDVTGRDLVQSSYQLSDQLFVQPEPRLDEIANAQARDIEMSPQEVAVALSHIEVWNLIALGQPRYTLVLEDDIYFPRGFANVFDNLWEELTHRNGQGTVADLVYLSYEKAVKQVPGGPFSRLLFKPSTGLWQLSGYILSKEGAQKLLRLLPVRGPVDLWLNHQFRKLDVFATQRPIIVQRPDVPSTNSYSVLPILSQVGVITREKPLLVKSKSMPGPVFAFGKSDSGLASLAMALSILGYRCCSDVTALPAAEHAHLFGKERGRVFDAYVNIATLDSQSLTELAKIYPKARFILTVSDDAPLNSSTRESHIGGTVDPVATGYPTDSILTQLSIEISNRLLILPTQHRDKWELLSGFLGFEYPAHPYPDYEDQVQRPLVVGADENHNGWRPRVRHLKRDSSPWIVPRKDWRGLPLAETGEAVPLHRHSVGFSDEFRELDSGTWTLRDDTFPSNLALFTPDNFAINTNDVGQLTLREENVSVRQFTSASIASRQRYHYGRFVADLRPSNVPGVITGMFLHRNAPRQEIDLEFLGKDTTSLLVNVYYNPGVEGTKLEYGYRGAPTLIDLGFDAASEFHQYEIEWCSNYILWRVDGRLVYKRDIWDPTPISHLPMQFNVNLWPSRSKRLAGRLATGDLPTQSYIRNIGVQSPS